jgi:UDP-N-acetylglucosamine 3-dehydrogenase
MIIGVAIIGMGSQGARRAPIYNAYQDCKLIGICDKIPSKKTFADTYHCDFSTDVDYFLKRNDVDLVQISTNASQQHHIAIKALEYGKHVAIEKPFTTKLEHGKEIAYNKKGLVFVEASERCNPAVLRLKEYVQDFSKVARMYHRRSGIFDPRINDVGVMLDLGFHEFDMGYFLTGKKPKVIYADLSEIMPSGYEHDARVFARFGKTASTIDVSWATKFKIRTLELTTAKENIILDYAG